MISRNLTLVLFTVSSIPYLKADEAISEAYFHSGMQTGRLTWQKCDEEIFRESELLEAIYKGIKEDGGKSYFVHGDEVTFHYSTHEQRNYAIKQSTDKIANLKNEKRKHFRIPRMNVFDADLVVGTVGLIENRNKDVSIVNTPVFCKARVTGIDKDGFVADVQFGNAKKAYFTGFDLSKIQINTDFELTDVVLVVGAADTSFGRQLTIRKLTDQELKDASSYVKTHLYYINIREWWDSTNRFTTKAEYMGCDGAFVILKKEDGSEIRVSQLRLSEEDRRWIKENRTNAED